MELVRKLPASHHAAFHPAASAGDVDVCVGGGVGGGDGAVRRDKTLPRLQADASTPKHFSSHQSRHGRREAWWRGRASTPPTHLRHS